MLFKKRFFEAIRAGRKTQTIRWWRRPMVRVGQLVRVPFLRDGRLAIEAVDLIAGLDELAEADALADGFDSRAEMIETLRAIYPELSAGSPGGGDRRLYRVRFHFE